MKTLYSWRKLSASKWDDIWPDQLSEFADRLAITNLVDGKKSRVEVFALSKADAERIVKEFGGSVRQQSRDWLASPAKPRPAIKVRGRLQIVATEAEFAALEGKPALLIPAGMAFGTGEHATTLNCLRFIADLAKRQDAPWEFLDLGCGSGILALAARALGAAKVEAGDYDPECVRVAKENVRLNELRGVAVRRMDVLEWKPERTWPVVAANLYSTILIQIAPKLARSLAKSGTLVFSGVMRDQEEDVRAAFAKAGLQVDEVKRQGKWVAGIATKRPRRAA